MEIWRIQTGQWWSLTEDRETDLRLQIQNEAGSSQGLVSDLGVTIDANFSHSGLAQTSYSDSVLPEVGNLPVELKNINNNHYGRLAIPIQSTSTGLPTPDFSTVFYQQQIMLNQQIFMQQQQTVNALISQDEGLS